MSARESIAARQPEKPMFHLPQSVAKSDHAMPKNTVPVRASCVEPSCVFDIFIGGFLDRLSRIVTSYRKAFSRKYPDHVTCYFEHYQYAEIIAAAMLARSGNAVASINIIGHSWGAVTGIKVANALAANGVIVDQVITIDPVARNRVSVLARATSWINVTAAPATSNGWDGDYYATLGGRWADWPHDKAAVHYWAPFHHNEFACLLEYVSLDAKCALSCLTRAHTTTP